MNHFYSPLKKPIPNINSIKVYDEIKLAYYGGMTEV